MKQKKIKNMAKLICHELNHYRDRPTKLVENIEWSEYNEEVSNRFKKMFLNILENRDNIRLEFNDELISISTEDIKSIKKKQNVKNVYSEDDYLRMDITKDGFQINKGYRQKINFSDKNMYGELISIVKESQAIYNSSTFNEIWTEIMKDSGVVRDHNLDELFNG